MAAGIWGLVSFPISLILESNSRVISPCVFPIPPILKSNDGDITKTQNRKSRSFFPISRILAAHIGDIPAVSPILPGYWKVTAPILKSNGRDIGEKRRLHFVLCLFHFPLIEIPYRPILRSNSRDIAPCVFPISANMKRNSDDIEKTQPVYFALCLSNIPDIEFQYRPILPYASPPYPRYWRVTATILERNSGNIEE